MDRLESARKAQKQSIGLNPYTVEYMEFQPYKIDPTYGKIEDGDIVTVIGFKHPIRVYEVEQGTQKEEEGGIQLPLIKKYIKCEYDEEIKYGQMFKYYHRDYMILEPEPKIKFGGIIGYTAELRDVSELV